MTGTGWNNGQCVGNTDAAASIGYPSLCLQDGPLGVRFAPDVTAFTPGIQAASTWDVDLIGQRAGFMAAEARALGVHVLLGPVVGPLGKVPGAGRNWEGFGPDPYLAGRAAAASVRRMQAAGVQATIKHLVANEQEAGRMSMSSNVDDAVLHEMYLAPFYDAVHAGVASAMCSYNRLNGVYACENDELLNKLLKRQMGFRGYVVSDWTAQHSTVNSALAGLDMSMPGSDFSGQGDVYWGPQLISAVQDGSVPERRVDDMATRILAAWYKVQQDEGYPSVDLSRSAQGSHARNVRAVARDGTVLLRNVDGILPLSNDNAGSIAVIGSGAVAGRHANNQCENHACSDGALGMGWGSGVVLYPYFSAPDDAIRARAGDGDRVTVTGTDDPGAGAAAAGAADISIVFITANAGEDLSTPVEGNAADRNNLDPWHGGNELVAAVAEASDNVIVVAHSPGPLDLSSILSHPSVKAVVWAGMPSQENGNALVDILWGDANPSGKLVYTIAKNADDYNTGVVGGDDSFPERLNVDYRYFDSADVEPEFEFGFGLCEYPFNPLCLG